MHGSLALATFISRNTTASPAAFRESFNSVKMFAWLSYAKSAVVRIVHVLRALLFRWMSDASSVSGVVCSERNKSALQPCPHEVIDRDKTSMKFDQSGRRM